MQLRYWLLLGYCQLLLTPGFSKAQHRDTMASYEQNSYTQESYTQESLAQQSDSANSVIMGVHNFPPEFVVSPDGKECGGSGVEQTRKMLASAGLQLKTVCVPPARLYVLLQQGTIDLTINIKSTAALQSKPAPIFVEPAFMNLQLVLYSHKQTSQAPRNSSVALIRAFDYQGQRQKLSRDGYLMVDLPDATSAIDMFVHQRTQHLLTYEGPFRAYLLNQNPTTMHQFDRRAIDSIPTYIVISAQSPLQQRIAEAIHQFAAAEHCRFLSRCGTR
jgi:polar amino acid transport system substrate-binding protein